ncbi:Uncharacterised protein [Amycolatopsis camponoti]|uniref:Uncharacterized protein n=1 Tax=Amycolatopsis camponoti TaxID=2606593 RepID=A0A6I8LU37_9PSEU|nr:Uncharacterised protein [Amycolatopsis camponoti]
MCRSRGGRGERRTADAGSNTGKIGSGHADTVPIRFRLYHKNKYSTRRRAFRLGCGHRGRGGAVARAAIVDASRVSGVPDGIRQVRVCPTVFWRR